MATSDDLCWMPASEMAPAIRRRKLSPVEVMKAVLARIERLNPRLNAFVTLLFADNVPAEDAPMVERMRAAGAIQLAKTNTPMMGWIGATHNLLFGITRNPWNLDRTPGGS